MRDRDRQRDRETETERQTERQRDRQRQRDRDRQRNRQRDRETETERQRQRDTETETERQRQRDRDRQRDREGGKSGEQELAHTPALGMLTQSLPCLVKRTTGGVRNTQENVHHYRRKEGICFFTHLRKSPSNTPQRASYSSAWK